MATSFLLILYIHGHVTKCRGTRL